MDSPIVQYGGEITAIHFTTDDGRWGRVTFEGLDSLKVSRGEYEPFPPRARLCSQPILEVAAELDGRSGTD